MTVARAVVADVNSLRALRRARDRIDRDDAEQLEVAALAAEAGYSLGQFIRAFDAAYGETPGRYRTRRRVERACDLLRSVNLTVTEVRMPVEFIQPPAERPYGIDAVLRDDSGSWSSFTQRRAAES